MKHSTYTLITFFLGLILSSQLHANEVTFVDDILPIVQERCTFCHTEASRLPFWEDYDVAYSKRYAFKVRVYERQDMPVSNITNMTLEERELIAQWVDEGAVYE